MNKIHRSHVKVNLAFSSRLYCLNYKNSTHFSPKVSKLTARARIQEKTSSLLRYVLSLTGVVLKPIIFMLLRLLTTDDKQQAIEYLAKARLLEIERSHKPTSRNINLTIRLIRRFSKPILKPMASRALRLSEPVLRSTAVAIFKLLRPEERIKTVEKLAKISLLEVAPVRKPAQMKMQQAIRLESQQMEKNNLLNRNSANTAKPQTQKKRRIKLRLHLAKNRQTEWNQKSPNSDSIAEEKISHLLKDKIES